MQGAIPTSLGLGSVVGNGVVVSVTLTGSFHGLVGPIAGQIVVVSTKWSTGSCVTRPDGSCQVNLSKPTKGSYTVTVKYVGNNYFLPSVATGVIVVK